MIRSTRSTYPIYAGDYIGGGRFAGGMGELKIPSADEALKSLKSLLPLTGGAGPEPLSAPQPGELGPQVTTQAMKAPQDQPVPTTNPNEVEPLRIAIAAQEAVAEEQDHTANLIKLGLLGIGGAMVIYGLGRVLEKHRARRRR